MNLDKYFKAEGEELLIDATVDVANAKVYITVATMDGLVYTTEVGTTQLHMIASAGDSFDEWLHNARKYQKAILGIKAFERTIKDIEAQAAMGHTGPKKAIASVKRALDLRADRAYNS